MNALISVTVLSRDIKFGLKVLGYHMHIMSILLIYMLHLLRYQIARLVI